MKKSRSVGCLTGFIILIVIIAALALIGKFVPTIFSAFAWITGISVVILVAVIVLIILLANKAVKSGKKNAPAPGPEPEQVKTETGTAGLPPEQAEILNKGRADLLRVRKILARIHNLEVSKAGNDICASLDKLLQALRGKPEKIKGCRQFLNYYIPTLGDVLSKYSRLEANGVVTQENTDKVVNFLIDFRKACGKQYQSLFDDDKLDMTVDMEAMMIAVRRDGLLDDDPVQNNSL